MYSVLSKLDVYHIPWFSWQQLNLTNARMIILVFQHKNFNTIVFYHQAQTRSWSSSKSNGSTKIGSLTLVLCSKELICGPSVRRGYQRIKRFSHRETTRLASPPPNLHLRCISGKLSEYGILFTCSVVVLSVNIHRIDTFQWTAMKSMIRKDEHQFN